MTQPNDNNPSGQPLGLPLTDQLGQLVAAAGCPPAEYVSDGVAPAPIGRTYTKSDLDAAVAEERERWGQERAIYRSLLAQARLVLRGPHTDQNIVVRELVERIESRGVQFKA